MLSEFNLGRVSKRLSKALKKIKAGIIAWFDQALKDTFRHEKIRPGSVKVQAIFLWNLKSIKSPLEFHVWNSSRTKGDEGTWNRGNGTGLKRDVLGLGVLGLGLGWLWTLGPEDYLSHKSRAWLISLKNFSKKPKCSVIRFFPKKRNQGVQSLVMRHIFRASASIIFYLWKKICSFTFYPHFINTK